jgi:hypothetical protein
MATFSSSFRELLRKMYLPVYMHLTHFNLERISHQIYHSRTMKSLLFVSLITLCFFLSAVVAIDHRQSVYDVGAVTTPSEEEGQRPSHARTRRALASSSSFNSHDDKEAVDPFNNYMVLAENEDALIRALGSKYGSIKPPTYKPKPGKGVSHLDNALEQLFRNVVACIPISSVVLYRL